VGRLLMKLPGVEAVYVRHTHPRSPSFVPGHSDLDLTVVLSDQAAEAPEKIEAVADLLERRRLFHYYLSPEDARITTTGELARLTGGWPPMEILVSQADWTLLAGMDVRRAEPLHLPARRMPWHPEFNRWWGHILQDYLLLAMPGLENQYHRVFYRGAVKQAAYFMAARGLTPPQTGPSTDHGLAEWVFRNDPGMKDLLTGLEERGFWEGGQQGLRERIFCEVLRRAEDFFADLPSGYRLADKRTPTPAESGLHAAAYDVLASKLNGLPELKSRLAGVLAYPTPYCHPYFYQADMLLPERISEDELTDLADILRKEFRGREFSTENYHFSITLVPEKVYRVPLAFRGTPFPFLPEHVGRYGRMLFGDEPAAMKDSARMDDLAEWCRIFFPFFAFNLGRRVEHSSRTLNFCQMAAVRLFLTTGEFVTDALFLRARHAEVFGDESPPPAVWDYLLRDKPGRREQSLYRSAASHLAAELARVEKMLDATDGQRPPGGGKDSLR
jgi:hypothetical protein